MPNKSQVWMDLNCVKPEFAVSHTLRTIIVKTQYDVTYNYLRKKSLFVKKTMVLFQRKQYTCCKDKSNTNANMIRLKTYIYKCYNKLILFSLHHDQRSFGLVHAERRRMFYSPFLISQSERLDWSFRSVWPESLQFTLFSFWRSKFFWNQND